VQILVQPYGRRIDVFQQEKLLDAARKAGIALDADCGGNGRCGQCVVQVVHGDAGQPTPEEKKLLAAEHLEDGCRLACRCEVTGDLEISLPRSQRHLNQRLQLGAAETFPIDGGVVRFRITPPDSTVSSGTSLFDHVLSQLKDVHNHQPVTFGRAVVEQLAGLWKDTRISLDAVVCHTMLAGFVQAGGTIAGLAVDLGSTKIAATLVDLETGENLGVKGIANPQIVYGDDIISRLAYGLKGESEREELAGAVLAAVNMLGMDLAHGCGLDPSQIVDVCLVGNTAMTHLFLQLPVESLSRAPYVPVLLDSTQFMANELGMEAAPGASVLCPSGIGGFVGSDHTAMLLAASLGTPDKIEIGIDIGTNTEIFLQNRGRFFSTSCASGPAFEGAHIRCGMRAASGAIEKVSWDGRSCEITTIEETKPLGICGAGLIELLHTLNEHGIINRRGHLQTDAPGVRIGDSGYEYVIVGAAESGNGEDIVVTQKDISEVQLAKAAIYAGLQTLLTHTGTSIESVTRVVLAGAFGSYLNLESAAAIGLLPDFCSAEFVKIGNGAADGAAMLLCSATLREKAVQFTKTVEYVQLENCPGFKRHLTFATQFNKG
jgi:uncharacterized 2Fe-2S/4Fe-4S cluster protein (DUF4445 family)